MTKKTFAEINADRPGKILDMLQVIEKSRASNRAETAELAALLAPVHARLAEMMGETTEPTAPVAMAATPATATHRHRIPLVVAAIPDDQLSAYLTQIAARMCEAHETR